MNKIEEKQKLRREEVIDCVWRVIIRDGADRTSIRSIATELGGTTGIVTHYFRNKEALMLFALDRIMSAMWQINYQEIKKGIKANDILEEWLRILPTTKQSQDNWRVWVSFIGYAVSRDKLMSEYRKYHDLQIREVTKDFKKYQDIGAIKLIGSAEAEAVAFLGFMDGLGTDWVISPKSYNKKVLRNVLETVYGHRLKNT